jgi:8-oxo-dGTP pyrophosphatase MutT (NUDIX family)
MQRLRPGRGALSVLRPEGPELTTPRVPAWPDVIERLRERLAEGPPPALAVAFPHVNRPVAAAVLVPIVPPGVLLYTHRSAELPQHAGQVSFPGGKCEPGDDGPCATALRETREELGIDTAPFEIIGRLADVATPTGFVITPCVGLWRTEAGPLALRLLAAEVAAAYFVPLDVLARDDVATRKRLSRDGLTWTDHQFDVPPLVTPDGRPQPALHVWGATGRMTRQLLDLAGIGSAD